MFGFKKKQTEATPTSAERKPVRGLVKFGSAAIASITIGGILGAASTSIDKVHSTPVFTSAEPSEPTPNDIATVTPDSGTYIIPSTEAAMPTAPTSTETAPSAANSTLSAETAAGSGNFLAAPAHTDSDDARLDMVHESTSYQTLTSEQKVAFDQAAQASFEQFAQLDYKDRALYGNVILRGSYQDIHAMTAASDSKLDTSYFDKHTWPDGMGTRPDQIADKVEGPANYIGILLAFAYQQGGETGAKLLASAYIDTSSSNEHFNEMLSTLTLMQDGGMPTTADIHFLEGKSFLDRVVANHTVSEGAIDGKPSTIYTADLNNPKKTPSDIQISLVYDRFETPESGYSTWIIAPDGLNYPTDDGYDASLAPAPGH